MGKTIKQAVNVDKALAEDKAFNEGSSEYQRISEQAQTVSEELASTLIESIVKSSEGKDDYKFTLTSAILSAAKTLTNLTSYAYEDHESFMKDITKARQLVVSLVIPALLNPRPCEQCVNCKNGKFEECLSPVMDTENTSSRFLPLVANFLLEYDLWTKILYMYTEGKVPVPEYGKEDPAFVDKPVDNVDNISSEQQNGGN